MILAILVTMLGAASAQTGITVQFYTDTSCSTIQAGVMPRRIRALLLRRWVTIRPSPSRGRAPPSPTQS